jgi:hypothetical protein
MVRQWRVVWIRAPAGGDAGQLAAAESFVMRVLWAAVLVLVGAAGCDSRDAISGASGPVESHPPAAPGAGEEPTTTPPGQAPQRPARARADIALRLGGPGDTWARNLAACPDGAVLIASASGPPREDVLDASWYFVVDPHDQPRLGLARLEHDGTMAWAREASTDVAGTRVAVAGLACGADLSVLAVAIEGGTLDLGGGPIQGNGVVVLARDGRVLRQFPLTGEPRAVGVDPAGNIIVATATRDMPPSFGEFTGTVTRFTSEGEAQWSRSGGVSSVGPAIAVSRQGDVVIGWRVALEKVEPSGLVSWSNPISSSGYVDAVGVAEDGTVVAGGVFIGDVSYAGTTLMWDGPGWKGYLAHTDACGTPRSFGERDLGPMAVGPDGRAAILASGKVSEVYPIQHGSTCSQQLVGLETTGEEADRHAVATCAPVPNGDAWWAAVAVGPDGGVWVVGDAKLPLDLGDGLLIAEHRDLFLARFGPQMARSVDDTP